MTSKRRCLLTGAATLHRHHSAGTEATTTTGTATLPLFILCLPLDLGSFSHPPPLWILPPPLNPSRTLAASTSSGSSSSPASSSVKPYGWKGKDSDHQGEASRGGRGCRIQIIRGRLRGGEPLQ